MKTDILHKRNWASSAGGREIELWQSRATKRLSSSKNYLFIGGVHGDEPEGVQLARDLLSWLSKNHTEVPHSWTLIPCLNPDGHIVNKRTNDAGVDLNRNFPSSDWNPEFWAPRYNPGPSPGSEPEVKALCSLIQQTSYDAIFHFHSWMPGVIYTGEGSKKIAEDFARHCMKKATPDIGYPTPGSLGQFSGLDLKIPTICIEHQENSPLDKVWSLYQSAFINLLIGKI